jgi:LuxR family maltose regulon positive regulatory protein
MPDTLLRTKLFAPPLRSDLISRPRLIERLHQALQPGHKLTLISAAAGFGKTTLVSAWVQQTEQPFAWLSLDENDNDLIHFLTYIIAALQTIESSIGKGSLAALQSPGTAGSEIILTPLLNEITEFANDLVLILDDYHVVESQPVDEALTFLLDHLPANMHLVVATRVDPPLPLARLRGRGHLVELRTADLRFTREEVATFLNQVMSLGLSTDDIAALESRTEGWIVGLQLAALSMQDREDITGFIQSFTGSHHHILDYLGEEVLGQQTAAVQSFLLRTSILERLTGPLCDAVCGMEAGGADISDGQETLEQLAKSNLFIVPLDDERRWYRYHHLFADLLQSRLQRLHPDLVPHLHLRAVAWFEAHGLFAEAVEHAFSAADYDRAASLIEQVASGTMLHGRLTTILNWVDALPERLLDRRPRLRFYQAWALSIGGRPKTAEKLLLDAKSTLDSLPDSPEKLALRGELVALLTGIILNSNDPPRIIREAEEALTYLPEERLISRARVYLHLGIAYAYADKLQKSNQTLQQSRDLALRAKNPFLAAVAIELLADMQIYHQGRLQDGVQSIEQILELGRTAEGTQQAFTGNAYSMLAEINLEWNNLEMASRYLERSIELQQQGGIGYGLTHTYCAKARLELAFGKSERAIEALQAAKQATKDSSLMQFLYHNLAYQVKLALFMGDTETAVRWVSGAMGDLPESPPLYLYEIQQIARARVYLARGDLQKTIATLDYILPQAASAGRMAHVIDINLLQALALQEQDKPTAAIKCLKSCLSLAAPEGYLQTFVEYGEPLARLLSTAAARGVMPDYVADLLALFEDGKAGDGTASPPPLFEPLSQREVEILGLVAEGLTNREISESLFLALDTVKGHNHRIFGKLGVKNRTQAVNKAISLKILPSQ